MRLIKGFKFAINVFGKAADTFNGVLIFVGGGFEVVCGEKIVGADGIGLIG